MKRGAEQLISPKGKKIKTEQIQYVPNEIWQVIFAHLPPSFLGTVRQVSTGWHALVHNLSEQSLYRYFPYLINHPDYQARPLKLFVQEYQRYHDWLPTIPMDTILSVLEGNTESILSESDPGSQKILYGLHFVRGYPLPKKGLSEENILEIKGWAIFFAAWQGNTQIFEELLVLEGINARYKNMALWSAAQNGHAEVVAQLVAHGVGINTTTHNGSTLVYIAAENGHVEVIAKLVELGADVNTPNNDGVTPIFVAAQNGHVEVIVKLAEHGADVNTAMNDGVAPVFIAAQEGHVEVIVQLVALGADVNIADNNGATPTYVAAESGHIEAIIQLAVLGANVNTPNNNGATPVFIAAQQGHVKAIVTLVELGANINAATDNGVTPICVAARNGHVDVIAKLVELGADVNIPNNYGITPVFIAAQNRHVEVITKLVELGADVNTPNNDGATPTFMAAENGHVGVIAKLVELGANVNIPNNYGATPVFIAAQEGHAEVVQFLLKQNVHIQAYISSAKSLYDFAQSCDNKVIDRMDQLIKEKIEEGNPVEKIPLLPSEIAYIMGYDEIVNMFKTSNEVVTAIESHLDLQPPAITFTFDAKKDPSSSFSEGGAMEMDKNNQEQSFLSRDYYR